MSLAPSKRNRSDEAVHRDEELFPLQADELLSMISDQSVDTQVKLFTKFAERLSQESNAAGEVAIALLKTVRNSQMSAAIFWDLKFKYKQSFLRVGWKSAGKFYGYPYPYSIPIWKPESISLSSHLESTIAEAVDDVSWGVSTMTLAEKESKLVKWVDAVIMRILSVFRGVIKNDAEGSLPATEPSSGGLVEFIFRVLEHCVFLVIVCKREDRGVPASTAQILCELEAAWHSNRLRGLTTTSMKGILCIGEQWRFFEYTAQSNAFRMSTLFTLETIDEVEDVKNLMHVAGAIFLIFLEGYLNSLRAFIHRSREMTILGGSQRPSLPKWEESLEVASAAVVLFKNATSDTDFDAAVKKLKESFAELPEEHGMRQQRSTQLAYRIYAAQRANQQLSSA